MTKKKRRTPVSNEIQQMRFQIALHLGYINPPKPEETINPNWWENLTNPQKSNIQGQVTKLLITKAQVDMKNGLFTH